MVPYNCKTVKNLSMMEDKAERTFKCLNPYPYTFELICHVTQVRATGDHVEITYRRRLLSLVLSEAPLGVLNFNAYKM